MIVVILRAGVKITWSVCLLWRNEHATCFIHPDRTWYGGHLLGEGQVDGVYAWAQELASCMNHAGLLVLDSMSWSSRTECPTGLQGFSLGVGQTSGLERDHGDAPSVTGMLRGQPWGWSRWYLHITAAKPWHGAIRIRDRCRVTSSFQNASLVNWQLQERITHI